MTEQSSKSVLSDPKSAAIADTSPARDATRLQTPQASQPVPQEVRQPMGKRKLVAGALGVAVLAVIVVLGIPWVEEMLNTVSTATLK